MHLELFHTSSDESILSRLIRRIANGSKSHSGSRYTLTAADREKLFDLVANMVFIDPPGFPKHMVNDAMLAKTCADISRALRALTCENRHFRFYVESIWSKDEITGKTGVRGPRDWKLMENWLAETEKHHCTVQPIPTLTSAEAWDALAIDLWAIPRVEYARTQLKANLKGFIFKAGISFTRRTPWKWTCCEKCIRCLSARIQIEHLKVGQYLYDEYAPSSAIGPGLYELIEAIRK